MGNIDHIVITWKTSQKNIYISHKGMTLHNLTSFDAQVCWYLKQFILKCSQRNPLADNEVVWSILTFIGHLEAEGAAGVICFEIEPHLVTGADHKVWSCGTRQATKRDTTGFLKIILFVLNILYARTTFRTTERCINCETWISCFSYYKQR